MDQLSTTPAASSTVKCDMLDISTRFKEERKRLGLSQKDAAKALGVSISSLGTYERNQVTPLVWVLLPLYQLGADIQYIVTGERSSARLPDTEQQLISAFRSAPQPVQAGILAMLQVVPVTDASASDKSQDVNPKFMGKVGQVVEGDVKIKGKQTFKF
ncbi:helix-turn-helix domain-containing protein [Iodobacter ciconiae]|uniref:XRE family transcriptional regulator n=1 Tax=Iodobacter ciconiae TaxID=2496266 RepID=A0A3S8ZPX2_9NEIS|nr:helix-turn-helix transcriptional regulator [Iodobacter ciconiae]AZN35514.1 XRE family transcriptional regulator [Iodobacter ciconiae]